MMGQQLKPHIETEYLLETSNEFYQDLLGYKPKQTSLKQISKSKWNEFIAQKGLNPNSLGIYLPRNQTAIIQEQHCSVYPETRNSGANPLSLFHEYFGHGLYCEQSLSGRELVNLEKKLLKEEIQEFQDKSFTLEDVQKFRLSNQTFQELQEFKEQNLGIYESFAVFTEYLLSNKIGLKYKFEKRYENLSEQDKEGFNKIINFNKQFGDLATFYEFGLARRTTPKRVRKILETIYGDKLGDTKFALLYGSKKDFSDIDIFIVGKNPQESHSDFLDVKMQSSRDLKKGIKNFDVRTIIPLINGKFIFGEIGRAHV